MKIFVAGHRGLVGTHIIQKLNDLGYGPNLILRTHKELDLTNQAATYKFFETEKPDTVIMCAGRVGGIIANQMHNGDMIRENLLIAINTIEAARQNECTKFCYLGSSCIYPRLAPQPIKEEYLLGGLLELSNFGYASSKITGVQTIKAYREQYGLSGYYCLMPTNLYGKNDNFDLTNSHVLPALIRKFHEGKINNSPFVEVWGSGKVYREFMYVEDLADIIVKTLVINDIPAIVNIGSGQDILVSDLAFLVKKIVGYDGEIKYDPSKPDGTPRKLLCIDEMKKLGLEARTSLENGLRETYKWYVENRAN